MSAAEQAIAQAIKGAPYMPINFDQDNEADWLEKRRLGIGGSDAATVIGLNPYKTAYQLWAEKTGRLEPEDLSGNDRIYFGHKLEDLIADVYSERTGRKVRRRRQILRSKAHPFMLANIDRDVVGEARGLECKNVDKDVARFSDAWGPSGTDQVPESYFIQCQHYMAVMGYEVWDLAALVGGNEIRIYTIERNDSIIDTLIAKERDFWRLVESGEEPEIDWEAKSTSAMLKRMYGPETVSDEKIVLPEEALHWHKVKEDARKKAKEYEKVAEVANNHLMAMAGDAGTIYIPGLDGGYTRKVVKTKGYTVEPSEYVRFAYSKNVK